MKENKSICSAYIVSFFVDLMKPLALVFFLISIVQLSVQLRSDDQCSPGSEPKTDSHSQTICPAGWTHVSKAGCIMSPYDSTKTQAACSGLV